MSAHPGEGTDVPEGIDIHTTAGKLEDLGKNGSGRRATALALDGQPPKIAGSGSALLGTLQFGIGSGLASTASSEERAPHMPL